MTFTFKEWLSTKEGKACVEYPLPSGSEYLRNRLLWAFQAGMQSAIEDAIKIIRETKP